MKKIISLLLCMVMTLSIGAVASGCKSKDASGVDTGLLKGQTIKIAAWGDVAEPVEGTEIGDLQWENIRAAEEKYGCEVEFVLIADLFTQMVTAATTGQKIADIITTRMHKVIDLMMKGDYFWAVEDLGGNPADEIYNQDTTHYAQYNGKTYGWYYNPTNVNNVMVINKSIIERAGGKIPYDLVEDRKWTFEEWKKLMLLGTDVENGIYGGGRAQSTVQAFMHANDTSLYTEVDGIHIANTDDTKLAEVMEFLTACTVTDKIYQANKGTGWDYASKQFIAGKYVTCPVGLNALINTLPEGMSDEWGIMPFPIGPSATEYKKLDAECKGFAIQKAVEENYAKALFQFMNEAMIYPMDYAEGMESTYKAASPDKESFEVLSMLQELPLTVLSEFTNPDLRNYSGNSATSSLEGMSTGTMPIRSTLDSIKPEIQGILDEYYGQTTTAAE